MWSDDAPKTASAIWMIVQSSTWFCMFPLNLVEQGYTKISKGKSRPVNPNRRGTSCAHPYPSSPWVSITYPHQS